MKTTQKSQPQLLSLFLQRCPRAAAEPAVLSRERDTSTWDVPVGLRALRSSSGTSAPANIFLRPPSRDLHFPAEEFKLPPDAQMKLQGGRTPLTSRWKQRGCKDGEGD